MNEHIYTSEKEESKGEESEGHKHGQRTRTLKGCSAYLRDALGYLYKSNRLIREMFTEVDTGYNASGSLVPFWGVEWRDNNLT